MRRRWIISETLNRKWTRRLLQSETHFEFKSRERSFVKNIDFGCQTVLKLCTEHGGDTAVICARFQNELTTEQWGMGKTRCLDLRCVSSECPMMTSSNRNIFSCYWPFVRGIHRSPVNSPHKGQWRAALIFSLVFVWINAWVNTREAGDLRRHRTHYDVIVMYIATADRCGWSGTYWGDLIDTWCFLLAPVNWHHQHGLFSFVPGLIFVSLIILDPGCVLSRFATRIAMSWAQRGLIYRDMYDYALVHW